MIKLFSSVIVCSLLNLSAAAPDNCVCAMQGRFVGGQFQFDLCENGNCNVGIPEGLCELRAILDNQGDLWMWCDCEFSPKEWPTFCLCSGYLTTGPTPVVCWSTHGCWYLNCNTDHWWPLPGAWTNICDCN